MVYFKANFDVVDVSNTAFDFSSSNAVGLGTTTGWTDRLKWSKVL